MSSEKKPKSGSNWQKISWSAYPKLPFKKILSRIFYSEPVLFLTGWLVRLCTFLLFSTLRIRMTGREALLKKSPLIIALWHDKLLLAPLLTRVVKGPLGIVVSKSRDGRLLAAYATTYSQAEPIFVAHNMRHSALVKMVGALEGGKVILITPDGPRGPKHEVKPGIFFSAEKAGAEIVAMRWHASRVWKLSSWDRLQIPKPFAKVEIAFEPVLANPSDDLQRKLSN